MDKIDVPPKNTTDMKTPQILYEDNHIIVAVKPENLPVQGDSSGDTDMLTLLKAYIKEKYNKPGNVYLGLVHRLDRPVGGVMVFARTSKAAERLTNAFAKKLARKSYAAVVCGKPAQSGTLECYMRKDERTFSAQVCRKEADGAKFASLSYVKTAEKGRLSLLDISLKTGRHHQIRLQLSDAGMPIYADHRYNPEFFDDTGTNIALFAYSLEIEHPTTHERMRFTKIPCGGIWDDFTQNLLCMVNGVCIVYEDENIAVCDKPKGVSVAISDGGTDTLEERLLKLYDFAKPVHRLDATTEGLVMFARNEESYELLLAAFASHGEYIHKFYKCTVSGVPREKQATLTAYMTKDDEKGFVHVSDGERDDAKQIITKYRVKKTEKTDCGYVSELEVELITGRTHQIRAHLAHIGHPILGDDKYGDREMNKKMHMRTPVLRSERMSFSFPKGHKLHYLNEKF